MADVIYNEGRVVGYSAYELFVRQFIADHPEAVQHPELIPPVNEWLEGSLISGVSLLMKVPATVVSPGSTATVSLDLPTTALVAASAVVGSLFMGQGIYSDVSHPNFATALNDLNPVTDEDKIEGYAGIIDGTISKDSSGSHIHLVLNHTISAGHEPEVILSGFLISRLYAAMPTSAVDSHSDFLGPVQNPSTVKVLFSVPTSFLPYVKTGYSAGDVFMTYNDSTGMVQFQTNHPGAFAMNIAPHDDAGVNNALGPHADLEVLVNSVVTSVLETRLRRLKSTLVTGVTNGEGGGYIEFGPDNHKLRFYIASKEPSTSGVPEGSIGIGWGLDA